MVNCEPKALVSDIYSMIISIFYLYVLYLEKRKDVLPTIFRKTAENCREEQS